MTTSLIAISVLPIILAVIIVTSFRPQRYVTFSLHLTGSYPTHIVVWQSIAQGLKIVQNTRRPNQDFAETGPCMAFWTTEPGARRPCSGWMQEEGRPLPSRGYWDVRNPGKFLNMQNPAFWCTCGDSNKYLLENGITYGCYTVLEKPHEYVLLLN
jgi:hypothetical protein